MDQVIDSVLRGFGLNTTGYSITRIHSGHINHTYKIEGASSFVLQRINKEVFKNPQVIADNLKHAASHLSKNFPDYLFLHPLEQAEGSTMVYDVEGFPWRLFPYIHNTTTINEVKNESQAYNAAEAFAKLTRYLNECNVQLFKETIPQFHNLSLRFLQFTEVLAKSDEKRKARANDIIEGYLDKQFLVAAYKQAIKSSGLKLRIVHNDTKINNVLFDTESDKAVCVIDLDTLMPGYFFYDLGDMIRTFVSPVSEEAQDYSKITIRKEIYEAVMEGYLSQMGDLLTAEEKTVTDIAGPIMTYLIGMRFLTDYLGGDFYFHTTYEEQNLVRAGNQLRLLELLLSRP